MDIKNWFDSIYKLLFAKTPNEDLEAFPNLPLVGSVFWVLLVDLAYLGFVLKLGPRLMRNRPPFQLKKVMMAYNATQVLICSFLACVGVYYVFFEDYYEIGCLCKLAPGHPLKPTEVAVVYTAYLVKYFDYLDTIFFVLRKSYRQLTFLHVYHHLFMSIVIYVYLRTYGFGGHSAVVGFINVFVHAVMYTYYFMAAYKPELKKSAWWKRHITELQILQFLTILVHNLWPLVVRTDCKFPRFWLYAGIAQACFFLYLFGKFYKKAYLRKKPLPLANGFVQAKTNGLKVKLT